MDIKFLDGYENMDFERVTEMLADTDWSPGIKIEEVKKGAANSALVAGAFYEGRQVGYARVISDKTRFAYISDVLLQEEFRGKGIGRGLMQYILNHEQLKDVYQWLLRSAANAFYDKVGFYPMHEADRWMEIWNKRPER